MTEVSDMPRTYPLTSGQTCSKEGLIFKKSSGANTYEITTSVDDNAAFVADQAWVDAEQNARTSTGSSSDRIAGFHLGCGKVVNVASIGSVTYTTNCKVYLSQTADSNGMCDADSSNSATCIGHYVGDGETTDSTDGATKIPVILDVASAE